MNYFQIYKTLKTWRNFGNAILIASILLISQRGFAQQWSMSKSSLMTPWAEKIDVNSVLPEYPRPQMVRDKWLNLNGIWQFQEAEAGETAPSGKKLKEVILVPFPWESAISGIHRNISSKRAWYRKTFSIPKEWKSQNIILNFGAIDWESVIYINGKCVGIHKGGYDSFSFNITSFLNFKNIDQEIIVGVYDPGSDMPIASGKQSNDRFSDAHGYSYTSSSGIWQTVWLEPVENSHISDIKIVPDIDKELIEISASATKLPEGASIVATVKEGNSVIGKSSGAPNLPFIIKVPSPRLWSPDTPFLYDVEISIQKDDKVIDIISSYCGMRKISIELENGLKKIYLNNKFLFQMGPLDQGYWPDGIYTAPTDEALRWDIENIKEFGFNMVRKHIKVEPERWYYWCDKLGLLVWQDMPGTFKKRTEEDKTQFESELNRMVKTHWNHPSIVDWIVFNEHWGLYDVERLTNNVMLLDPSRLVTGNSGIDAAKPHIDFEVGHICDNHSYRPPNCPFPSNKRAVVCGEYGAIGYNVEGHIWDIDGPWVHFNYAGIDSATVEYEKFISQVNKFQNGGLSAAVYTQWTDVENEMNGLYTYDRKVIKLYKDRIKAANQSTYFKKE